MEDRSREIIRLATMLEDASIKLSSVASSLSTVSARGMLAAMIAGERNLLVLADLAKCRMRSKTPELAQTLEGSFDEHHARLAGAIIARLDMVDRAIGDIEDAIRVDAAS